MTPRLEVPSISEKEDLDVWYWVARKFSDAHGSTAKAWNILGLTIRSADRSDADLMYIAQCRRLFSFGTVNRSTPVRVHGIDCGWILRK